MSENRWFLSIRRESENASSEVGLHEAWTEPMMIAAKDVTVEEFIAEKARRMFKALCIAAVVGDEIKST